jgi:hypothetical protein
MVLMLPLQLIASRTSKARRVEMTVKRGKVWLADLNPTLGSEQGDDRTLALEYCDRAFSIARKLGIPPSKDVRN